MTDHLLGRVAWSDTLRVNFVGDSIGMRGSFASTPQTSWQGLMLARFGRVSPVARGSQAYTTDTWGCMIGTISDVAGGDDLTFVMAGTNDERAGRSYSQVYADYAGLLDRILARVPATRLVCAGVWQEPGETTAHVEALIAEQAALHGGQFVPLSDLFPVASYKTPTGVPAFGGYVTDGFHPNDTGHLAIYNRLRNALQIPA